MAKHIFSLLLAAMLLTSAAMAEIKITPLEKPETAQQQFLFDLSESESDTVLATMLATRAFDMDPSRELEIVDDALYDFIENAGENMPEATSVVLFIPTEQFGEKSRFRETDANVPSVWNSYAMSLAFSVNSSANNEHYQAAYLDRMSATSIVEAWPGRGIAGVLRLYGEYGCDDPQLFTVVSLSEDSQHAVAKTTLIYYSQIAERPYELFDALMDWYGEDSFEIYRIKPQNLS